MTDNSDNSDNSNNSENAPPRDKMVPIGGLWKNKTKDGKIYFSGYLNSARILVFQNTYKKDGTKEPDLVMYVAPSNKQKGKKGEKKQDEDLDKMFG